MTEAKAVFDTYKKKRLRADHLWRQFKELRSIRVSTSLVELPHGFGPGAPTERTALEIVEVKERLLSEYLDAEKMAFNIMKLLDGMEDQTEADLLFYRYIMLYTWNEVNEKLTPSRGGQPYEVNTLMGVMKRRAVKSFQSVLDSRDVQLKDLEELKISLR